MDNPLQQDDPARLTGTSRDQNVPDTSSENAVKRSGKKKLEKQHRGKVAPRNTVAAVDNSTTEVRRNVI